MFKRNQIVKDEQGNHLLFLRKLQDGLALVESVATRECFCAPMSELSKSDRTAF